MNITLKQSSVYVLSVLLFVCCQSRDSAKPDINKERQASEIGTPNAVTAKTQFAEFNGRKIAFRRFGKGPTMILCNRFRGTLDSWDPLFLDSLSNHFELITFDYSGIGRSALKNPTDSLSEVKDVLDLISYFKLNQIVLLGWSHGGKVAQSVAAHHPQLVSHLVLLGTGPLGKNEYPAEQIFFERALKPVNDLNDEVILFFEPASPESIAAAKATHERISKRIDDKDIDVPPDMFQRYFNSVAIYNADETARRKLAESPFPILVLSGDHDVVLPVENWYVLNRIYKHMFIVTFPSSGHAPHHQHPILAVDNIRSFVQQLPK
jgi:pimeloyl-ACP methyl ester carboxylesterase